MKNILYTIILSFLFSSHVFADWDAGMDAFLEGDYATALNIYRPPASLPSKMTKTLSFLSFIHS